ncbi:MAG: hypothetical protein V3V72_13600 [Ignavibacteriaceae bacterium]
MSEKQGIIYANNYKSGTTWTRTNRLRWKKTGKAIFNFESFAKPELELYQAWINDLGEIKWEAVEIVE